MDLLIIGFWVLFCLSLEDTYMRPFWWSISAKNHGNLQDSTFRVNTGRLSARIYVNLQDFPFRGYAGRLSGKNNVSLQDFPFRGYAGRLSIRNHVNLQYSLWRGDADIYERESCEFVAIPDQRPSYIFFLCDFYRRRKICYTYTISRTV